MKESLMRYAGDDGLCSSVFVYFIIHVSDVSTVGSNDYHSPWVISGIGRSDQACGVAD